MLYPAHTAIGLGTGILVGSTLDFSMTEIALFTATTTLGSIFPDIDHKGSWISKRMKLISFLFSFTVHRRETHSLVGILLLSLLSYVIGLSLVLYFPIEPTLIFIASLGFLIGMCSHSLLDMTTSSGVVLFYPFLSKSFSLRWFKTGGIGELFFQLLGVLFLLFGLYIFKS